MQASAAEVGFSETALAARADNGWRVRYFSPESEAPFCGHATIALGAALALTGGDGVFALTLNNAQITVEGHRKGDVVSAALQSPPTRAVKADAPLIEDALQVFGYRSEDLDLRIPPTARGHHTDQRQLDSSVRDGASDEAVSELNGHRRVGTRNGRDRSARKRVMPSCNPLPPSSSDCRHTED
jgi:predicted PhzF superfamily epimerase YddE/YHI9